MPRKNSWLAGIVLILFQMLVGSQRASAYVAMNYGADGNDYFQFTTPSMACDKASGFTTLITFAMHVDTNGTLEIGGGPVCSNGVYIGPTNWGSLITTLKTPPTTVTRYEVAIGGWLDTSYDNIKSVIAAQGNGPTNMLYKNFQALKNAVPEIDAINDDDEKTYDLGSSTSFANLLGGLGFKFTTVPYQNQFFWVSLNNAVTNCDEIYLQCYAGGAGNDPGQWNTAFGHGVKVIPGQESNTANPAAWRSWYLETGTQGGFYYPDVVFNTTYWSAAVIQANGSVPSAPTGVVAVPGGQQVSLSWNTEPGTISYHVKRSTVSGGETNVANISTANNNWPNSNQYIDLGLTANVAYYYEISSVNTNGEGVVSTEVSATPTPASVFNFEIPYIGAGNYQYSPSGGTWTFSGASPSGSGIVSDASAFGNPNSPGPNLQAGFIQELGSCSQAIAGFVPGTNYTITFSAAERGGNSQTWNVKIDSTVLASYNPGSSATAFSDYTANFTATAATHNLQFLGTDLVGGDNTVFIANVRISPPLIPLPTVVANTTPSTATDVVGGQVTFTTGFGGQQPMAFQWKMIKSGATNLISGATNATLAFATLQVSNSASYFLQASNAYGIALSTPAALTVNNVPAAVTNVITVMSAQTGLGGGIFTPTWSIAPSSLIAGQTPSVTNGSFSLEVAGRSVNALTSTNNSLGLSVVAGLSGTTCSTNYVTCGNGGGAGATIIYNLTGNTNGYCLTNITVYGGWADDGRDQQAYTLSYSKVSNPTNFIPLAVINYNPVDALNVQSATRASLRPAVGALATNVAAVKFDFTTPSTENGYCGYAQIQLFGVPVTPTIVADTLPATAADVVGSQVIFRAAFSGVGPLTYQWQKISGGVTNNIAGGSSVTLTLTNLQLSNTAIYQLLASNAFGVAVSSARLLTVNSVPAAVNNVITAFAAQTGVGPSDAIGYSFTPTWIITTNNSLIAGQSPGSANGNFSMEIPARSVSSLTAGGSETITVITGTSGYTTSTNYVTCGNGSGAGSSVIYRLAGSTNGYNLTNITVYGGWGDGGRDQQAYTVSYSTVAAPTAFIPLDIVNYNPANLANVQSATRATLTPATGALATNAAVVKFDFTTPASENGYCGYSLIEMFGVPTPVVIPPVLNSTNIAFQVTGNYLNLSWPSDHTGWRLQVQTNDPTQGLGTNWVDVAGANLTNQMVIPISTALGSVFYKMVYP